MANQYFTLSASLVLFVVLCNASPIKQSTAVDKTDVKEAKAHFVTKLVDTVVNTTLEKVADVKQKVHQAKDAVHVKLNEEAASLGQLKDRVGEKLSDVKLVLMVAKDQAVGKIHAKMSQLHDKVAKDVEKWAEVGDALQKYKTAKLTHVAEKWEALKEHKANKSHHQTTAIPLPDAVRAVQVTAFPSNAAV